jgi:hypothetical protein
MTGSVNLTAEQFQTIARGILRDFGGIDRSLARVVIHPMAETAKPWGAYDVKVETYENAWGDVLRQTSVVTIDGKRMTVHEHEVGA